MLNSMRTTLTTLGISGILVWFCFAQESATPVIGNATAPEHATSGVSKADQTAYYATLNRQEIEFNAQLELLNQLVQEHRKRAEETPGDQVRAQWETDLAKELSDRASAILSRLNNTSKERLAFEQTHPAFAVSVLANSTAGATNGFNPDAIAFLGKLAERRAAIQQEIAAKKEEETLYSIQLETNSISPEPARIYSLIQENADSLNQLQKELFYLDLKNLEFRALRKH